MVLKAFLFFSQQPKLEGGKWERKHFRLIFLQEMFPVRWERLPSTGMGWEGFAEPHTRAFGGFGTIVAVPILPAFLPSLRYRHTAKARRNDEIGKVPLSVLHCCSYNSRKHLLWSETNPCSRRFWHHEFFCLPCQCKTLKWLETGSCHVKSVKLNALSLPSREHDKTFPWFKLPSPLRASSKLVENLMRFQGDFGSNWKAGL